MIYYFYYINIFSNIFIMNYIINNMPINNIILRNTLKEILKRPYSNAK